MRLPSRPRRRQIRATRPAHRRSSCAAASLCPAFAVPPVMVDPSVDAGQRAAAGPAARPLSARIPLPGVYGRIDHYGWDSKRGILLVSALGNDTVEIVSQWRRVHTISGLEHPQASLYVPGLDRIVVSSQSGKLRFYDAQGYALIK